MCPPHSVWRPTVEGIRTQSILSVPHPPCPQPIIQSTIIQSTIAIELPVELQQKTCCAPQVTGMDAHLRYFERAQALFQNLQPYLQHSLDVVEKLKAEAGTQLAALENMILQHQQVGGGGVGGGEVCGWAGA